MVMAPLALTTGALGIGEKHDKPEGRNLAIRLIQSQRKLVKRLFVELPTEGYQEAVDEAKNHVNGGYDAVRKHLTFWGLAYKCTTALEDVVAQAIVKGVPVHCVDEFIPNGRTDQGLMKRNASAVEKACKIIYGNADNGGNNANAEPKNGKSERGARDEEAIGSLFLFGADHFYCKACPQSTIPAKYRDLRWVMPLAEINTHSGPINTTTKEDLVSNNNNRIKSFDMDNPNR